MTSMDFLPLWALFALVMVFSILSIEAGHRLGKLRSKRGNVEAEGKHSEGMVQATLALLAFLLAFTFGVASERFNERRNLVIQEANAIGTTYLRADFLPGQAKKEVQDLLRAYVNLRITRVESMEDLKERVKKAGQIQNDLWKQAVLNGKADLNSDIGALFVTSLNEMIDIQSSRLTVNVYSRVPDSVWGSLFLMMFLGLASIGYQTGLSGSRSWTTILILVLSFAIVISMIADLDRPREGFLKANLKPFQDLAESMGIKPASTND